MADILQSYSILGDSISTFQGYTPPGGVYYAPSSGAVTGVFTVRDTWWMRVIHALSGQLLANNSWSGSTVAAEGNLGACLPSRIRKLGPDGVHPDRVLIFSGLNDVARYVPVEQFGQDYNLMLRRVQEMFPRAEVFCGTLIKGYLSDTPFQALGYLKERISAYNDAIRSAVAANGCRLVDLAALGEEYASMDGAHPNGEGMEQLAKLWLRAMEQTAE